MYLKKLELKNFQCIRDFNANFEGNVYLVSGDNELGKSTVLKAVGALLTGKRDDVLTAGEKKGFAKAIIGGDGEEYEVSLSFTEANPRGNLTIKHAGSGMQSDNVSMLSKIFGYQDFDAVEFSRWSETAEGRRKQIEVIKKLLPVDTVAKIEALDTEASGLKSERTGLNRDIKTATAVSKETAAKLPADLSEYDKEIDMESLMQEQAERAKLDEKARTVETTLAQRVNQIEKELPALISNENTRHETALYQLTTEEENARKVYEMTMNEIARKREAENQEHTEKIAGYNTQMEETKVRRQNCESWLAKYREQSTGETVQERLQKVMTHNSICRQVAEWRAQTARLEEMEKTAGNIETRLNTIASERAELITGANLPVKGLSFGDDGLILNGIPFAPGKVSDSQIMEVAAQLIVAANPKVKVFRIGRGESLGAARLAAIVEMAKKNGFQGFIENVVRGQREMSIDEYTEAE